MKLHMIDKKMYEPENFYNRELSWILFNKRVLSDHLSFNILSKSSSDKSPPLDLTALLWWYIPRL